MLPRQPRAQLDHVEARTGRQLQREIDHDGETLAKPSLACNFPTWGACYDVGRGSTPPYALHDAVVKPMPGNLMTPSLADDVKSSFQRAKGARALRDRVKEVTTPGPHRVRFQLKEPWPDFMTFYGTLINGAAWIVPKKYVEQVGGWPSPPC
jgi:hypothetical protein